MEYLAVTAILIGALLIGRTPGAGKQVMDISQFGLGQIMTREGLRTKAYPDGDHYSIGYGHNGPDVFKGQIISENEAERLLSDDVKTAEKAINETITVPLTQDQFDALVSLVYNIGAAAFKSSALAAKLNKRDYLGASDEFIKWVYSSANGTKIVSDGLKERRQDETEQFLGLA